MDKSKNDDVIKIPYIVLESERARHERTIKRLIGVIALLSSGFIATIITNIITQLK